MIDLMEPEFSEPMLFEQRGGATQDPVFDSAQVVGVQSTVPKMSIPLALKDVKSPESSSLGLSSVYEYKRLLAYLKANSKDKGQTIITIRGKWTFLLGVSNTSGHLYRITLVVSNGTAVFPYFAFLLGPTGRL